MNAISLSANRDFFLQAGRPFFYLADTVWSAFTNAGREEWVEYLDYRQAQGFNALQINVLPQWDRSTGYSHPQPFRTGAGGRPDFGAPNEEYFERARAMCAQAAQRGFTPALAVLWCDYVPGTRCSARTPGHEILPEEVEPYCRLVAAAFAEYEPVYLVSGDTELVSPQTEAVYLAALKAMKKHAPGSLATLHLQPGTRLPESIMRAPELDFYMYQSGHQAESQDLSWRSAGQLLAAPVRRPIVNGEPCYEGHQFGNRYGRFGAFDVRKAVWQSLLAGAAAGVTYGAHGLWGWHAPGKGFPSVPFSGLPYDWHTALRFPGAWDAAFARWVFETYRLFGLQPLAEPAGGNPEIRAAATPDGGRLAVYLPYPLGLELRLDLSGYECLLLDLPERRILRPRIAESGVGAEKSSRMELPPFNGDGLLIGHRGD